MPMNYSLVIKQFDFHIIDTNGAENPVAHNLCRLENVLVDPLPIDDSFPDEQCHKCFSYCSMVC